MNEITLRKANKKDIDVIVEFASHLADFHHELDPDYWQSANKTEKDFRKFVKKRLKGGRDLILLAEDNGKVVGYFAAEIQKQHMRVKHKLIGNLANAYVLKKYRGRGITKRAVKEILDWFKKKKLRVARLSVDSRNPVGIKVWEGFGFKEFKKEMKLEL